MFSTDTFAEWAKDNVVLFLHNTSHCEGEPHPDLLQETGGNGFPTVSYLDSRGKLLKQLDFPTEMETLRDGLQELENWRQLKQQAADGDSNARKQLFMIEITNGMVDYKTAEETFKSLKFEASEQREIQAKLINLQFLEILSATPKTELAKAGAKFHAMWKDNRVPTSRQITTFWQAIFQHAVAERNVEMYAECLADVKARHAHDSRLKHHLPRLERGLESLRAALKK